MTSKILIVDDEKTLRHFLKLQLQDHGYEVAEAATGKQALSLFDSGIFDVALVDLHLTDMDGLDIIRHLKKVSPQTSVIVLTGHGTLDSAIQALRQGAHDYLLKPCDTTKLLRSVADGIARQAAGTLAEDEASEPTILQAQSLTVNTASRQVTRGEKEISLTPTEFDILTTLMSQPDTAIDSIALIKKVRGYEATEADARAIARVHVHRLRQKLEVDPANPQYVTTVAGGRYLFRSA